MGRKSNYQTTDLMEIVLQYADKTKHKIQYTELRDFARSLGIEFENIEDRHFRRNKIIADKVNEINITRNKKLMTEENLILYNSSPDNFFQLGQVRQREEILKTQEYVKKLERKIRELEYTNIQLEKDNDSILKLQTEFEKLSKEINRKATKILNKCSLIEKTIDVITQEKILADNKDYNRNLNLNVEKDYFISKVDELYSFKKDIEALYNKRIVKDIVYEITEVKEPKVIPEDNIVDINSIFKEI